MTCTNIISNTVYEYIGYCEYYCWHCNYLKNTNNNTNNTVSITADTPETSRSLFLKVKGENTDKDLFLLRVEAQLDEGRCCHLIRNRETDRQRQTDQKWVSAVVWFFCATCGLRDGPVSDLSQSIFSCVCLCGDEFPSFRHSSFLLGLLFSGLLLFFLVPGDRRTWSWADWSLSPSCASTAEFSTDKVVWGERRRVLLWHVDISRVH